MAPHRLVGDLEFLAQVLLPDDVASCQFDAVQMTESAQEIDEIAMDLRSRSGRITVVEIAFCRIAQLPEFCSVGRVKASKSIGRVAGFST